MAGIDCTPPARSGQPRSVALIQVGAAVPIILRSRYGQEVSLSALIDTGSEYSLIDVGLVGRLQPQWIDRWPIGAAGPSQQMADVYQVEIEITNLQIREFTAMLAAMNGQRHEIILGRTQLRSRTLIYDGPKVTVSLSR